MKVAVIEVHQRATTMRTAAITKAILEGATVEEANFKPHSPQENPLQIKQGVDTPKVRFDINFLKNIESASCVSYVCLLDSLILLFDQFELRLQLGLSFKLPL
ncbi:MAG: hypothetical protein EZS28_017559 [Streblomastix strix]|uniref:Uncharacterized protein n=1 Tax=Streblomastix strix TaxID=222440 RepID=A0A5J4VW19_9EUKA|nr:MAG: hypothetical protein EZS28_017559 [Streblomastix strix]